MCLIMAGLIRADGGALSLDPRARNASRVREPVVFTMRLVELF